MMKTLWGLSAVYSGFMLNLCSGIEVLNVCEGQGETIVCGGGIGVISARYGRFDQVTCPHSAMSNVGCFTDVLTDIKSKCEGETTCTLSPSNGQYGDPCPGTFKYMEVQYSCSSEETTPDSTTTTFSKTMTTTVTTTEQETTSDFLPPTTVSLITTTEPETTSVFLPPTTDSLTTASEQSTEPETTSVFLPPTTVSLITTTEPETTSAFLPPTTDSLITTTEPETTSVFLPPTTDSLITTTEPETTSVFLPPTTDSLTTASEQSTEPETTSVFLPPTTDSLITSASVVKTDATCTCICRYVNDTSCEDGELQCTLAKLKKKLTVDKTTLSSFKTKKISVYDGRTSATVIGMVAAAVITSICALLVIPDFLSVLRFIIRRRVIREKHVP